jgi:hypothetical protein
VDRRWGAHGQTALAQTPRRACVRTLACGAAGCAGGGRRSPIGGPLAAACPPGGPAASASRCSACGVSAPPRRAAARSPTSCGAGGAATGGGAVGGPPLWEGWGAQHAAAPAAAAGAALGPHAPLRSAIRAIGPVPGARRPLIPYLSLDGAWVRLGPPERPGWGPGHEDEQRNGLPHSPAGPQLRLSYPGSLSRALVLQPRGQTRGGWSLLPLRRWGPLPLMVRRDCMFDNCRKRRYAPTRRRDRARRETRVSPRWRGENGVRRPERPIAVVPLPTRVASWGEFLRRLPQRSGRPRVPGGRAARRPVMMLGGLKRPGTRAAGAAGPTEGCRPRLSTPW